MHKGHAAVATLKNIILFMILTTKDMSHIVRATLHIIPNYEENVAM